jgi:hypothetical protein
MCLVKYIQVQVHISVMTTKLRNWEKNLCPFSPIIRLLLSDLFWCKVIG